jgi:predicted double-glycine peptidase
MILVGFLIAGLGIFAVASPPMNDQFALPVVSTQGVIGPEMVEIEPLSELKFKNIVKQSYDYSCGSAALVTLLNSFIGMDVSERQAMEGMLEYGERDKIIARRAFSLLDMKRYVSSLGAQAAGFRGSIDDLAELDAPAIVLIDYQGFKHFVVFRGIRGDKVFLADPSSGYIVLGKPEFEKHWQGNTLFMVSTLGGSPTTNKLALTDRELGVFDYDMIKEGVADYSFRTDMANTAAGNALGIHSLRK